MSAKNEFFFDGSTNKETDIIEIQKLYEFLIVNSRDQNKIDKSTPFMKYVLHKLFKFFILHYQFLGNLKKV